MPLRCPRCAKDGQPCNIRTHHSRKRKTGPGFPVTVARCKTHRKHFTLYPPGFGPYDRKPVIRCAPDGAAVPPEGSSKHLTEFEDTLFHAAVEAKKGCAWARNSERGVPTHWWTTQLRHLALGARLLGLAHDLGDRVRDSIAATLRIPGLLLREHGVARGYRAIGAAICTVLEKLGGGASDRALRLLHCRHLADDRPCPRTWDPMRKRFERLPFRHSGTAAPT